MTAKKRIRKPAVRKPKPKRFAWIRARLKENSTYRGLIAVVFGLIAFFIAFRFPQYSTQVLGGAVAIIGAINVARSEQKQSPTP